MAEFTTACGQDGPEPTRPSSAMFLTACAVCAKALNNDEARECEKCGTRFCGETCENEHRAQGQICDDIAEDGGAELIHINQKGRKAWINAVSAHPDTKNYEKALAKAKKALAEKNSA